MHTSLTCLLLAWSSLVSTLPTSVAQRNYAEAREASRLSGRPLVVFVATGATGERASMDGELSQDARKVLSEQYVYVVLDAKADRNLVDALGIKQGNGFVITDRTTDLQAYFHDGKFAETDLVQHLEQFADPQVVVATTLTNAPVVQYSISPRHDGPGDGRPGHALLGVLLTIASSWMPVRHSTQASNPLRRVRGFFCFPR